jgi:phosphoglucomutase
MITWEKLCEPRCLRLERRSALPTDGDADGIVMQPNAITAILFDSQIDSRGWPDGVAKSVAPVDLIHALAAKGGVERTGTPLGFDCLGELLRGTLSAHAAARNGNPPAEPWKTISNQVGSFFPPRENFRLTPEAETKFTEKLEHDPHDFCGHEVNAGVRKDVRQDGLRREFRDGSRVCHRLSETEPVVRVGGEARGDCGLEKLRAAAKRSTFEQKAEARSCNREGDEKFCSYTSSPLDLLAWLSEKVRNL